MKVYLDTCSLHRPLDDRAQPRVMLEAEAVLTFLTLCENGQHTYVSSDVLPFEINRNPHPQRRTFVLEIVARAMDCVSLNAAIEQRALELERRGFRALDALHPASAETGQVDYFCTCDDRLLKRAAIQPDFIVCVVSPLQLIQELVP